MGATSDLRRQNEPKYKSQFGIQDRSHTHTLRTLTFSQDFRDKARKKKFNANISIEEVKIKRNTFINTGTSITFRETNFAQVSLHRCQSYGTEKNIHLKLADQGFADSRRMLIRFQYALFPILSTNGTPFSEFKALPGLRTKYFRKQNTINIWEERKNYCYHLTIHNSELVTFVKYTKGAIQTYQY